jgi:hypothetical protein
MNIIYIKNFYLYNIYNRSRFSRKKNLLDSLNFYQNTAYIRINLFIEI